MLTKTRVIEQDRRAQSLGHVKTSWALCWYAWVVLFEHTFGVGQPEPDSQRPDGQVFRHKLPFVGVAREPFRRCGSASNRHDVLDTHKSQAVPFFDVVECFRMLDIEVAVDDGPIHVLESFARHTM